MRLFTIPSRPVDETESHDVVLDLLPGVLGESKLEIAHLTAGGVLGSHASRRHVVAVLSGSGRVRGDEGTSREVGPGTLVVWEHGEHHQLWATTDLMAVVVESVGVIDFAGRFPEILDDESVAAR
ncbi:MAG TPA: hypothetical protein VN257_08105 [Actinotalea sp.]|nr:hypothetical protein [Actinotalea sp.]